MKPRLAAYCLAFSIPLLVGSCDTGFELTESTDNDTVYLGPTENASWRLILDEDGESFRLQKRSSPSSENNEFSMSGDYSTLPTGFTEFVIRSGRNSEISASELPALPIGEDGFVFFPFIENSNALIAFISTDTCPQSDVRGNALFLDRDSDTALTENFWISSFQYDVRRNQAEYSNAVSLDDNFSPLGDALEQTGGDCIDGVAEADSGDHYLSTRSAIIELRDTFSDDAYARSLTTRSRVISEILDFDSTSYVGFVHDQNAPDTSYLVSADCNNGFCTIFREEEQDELEMNDFVYEIEFDQSALNSQFNGSAIGSIVDAEDNAGNVVCTLNSAIAGSSSKFIMCNAQNPSNTSSLVTLILVDS